MDWNEQHILYLRDHFAKANAILFTGAGFSRGSKNIVGGELPLGSEVAVALWNIAFPDRAAPVGPISLPDVFESCQLTAKSKLESYLDSTFRVDPTSIPAWVAHIFSLPWLKIYTLNIDDLASATSRVHSLPRQVNEISALRVGGTQEKDFKNFLNVIHLNGLVNTGADGVTFSTTPYAERLAHDDPVYLQLAAELIVNPFVFIGTRLDESLLWQHIQLRRRKLPGRELRRRSFIVTPNLDLPRETMLGQFNVVWKAGDGEEFINSIAAQASDSISAGLAILKSGTKKDTSTIHTVDELSMDPSAKTGFFEGEEPAWSDVQAGRAIERTSEARCLPKILELKRSGGICCITGTAGAGTSTILKRLALRLSNDGEDVAWIDAYSAVTTRDFRSYIDKKRLDVVFIDDADIFGFELASLLRESVLAKHGLVLVIGMRSLRAERFLNRSTLSGIATVIEEIPHLTDDEIKSLIEVMEKENRLGNLRGLSPAAQLEAFRGRAERQLLVGLINASSGAKLEDKARTEFIALQEIDKEIYAALVVATNFRYGLTVKDLLVAMGGKGVKIMERIESMKGSRLIVERSGQLFVRHRVIAEIVFDLVQREGMLRPILVGLATVCAAQVRPDMAPSEKPKRMLIQLINHDFLYRAIGGTEAAALYDELEGALNGEPHYWLQRGCLEIESGNLIRAENFLSQARALKADDSYIITAWADLLFHKALFNVHNPKGPELVLEACALLDGAIANYGRKSPHAFHIYCSQGLAWCRRGLSGFDEVRVFLIKLRVVAEQGVREHPQNRELTQIRKDVENEYLSLALKR